MTFVGADQRAGVLHPVRRDAVLLRVPRARRRRRGRRDLKAIGIDTGWEILIFVMVLVFIMGFFFDWIEICLIVLPIFAPIMAKIDFAAFHRGPSSHPAAGSRSCWR